MPFNSYPRTLLLLSAGEDLFNGSLESSSQCTLGNVVGNAKPGCPTNPGDATTAQ